MSKIKTPAKPAKPSRPAVTPPTKPIDAAPPVTPPSKPSKPAAPAASAAPVVVVSAPPADVAKIADLSAKIAKLEAALAAAKRPRNVRSITEILDGAVIDAADWRAPYQGVTIAVHPMTWARGASRDMTIDTDRTCPALLALPRDTDLGGEGPSARTAGLIAVHTVATEGGDAYAAQPAYMTAAELAAIWAD